MREVKEVMKEFNDDLAKANGIYYDTEEDKPLAEEPEQED